MRNHDEVPYIVIEREGGSSLGTFFLGALLGAGLGLVFAPRSGAETQEEIKERARKLRSAAEDRMREAQRQLEDRLEIAREGVHTRFEGMKEAVAAGRSAAFEARSELERKLERSKAAYRAGVDAAKEAAATEHTDESGASAD